MHFKHVSESDVSTLIMQLGSGKATGCDGIPVWFVKMLCPYLAEPLTTVINRNLDAGIVLQCWKLAEVVPVMKQKGLTDKSNYRPISILPIMSKLMERIVHQQSMDYSFRRSTGFNSGPVIVLY